MSEFDYFQIYYARERDSDAFSQTSTSEYDNDQNYGQIYSGDSLYGALTYQNYVIDREKPAEFERTNVEASIDPSTDETQSSEENPTCDYGRFLPEPTKDVSGHTHLKNKEFFLPNTQISPKAFLNSSPVEQTSQSANQNHFYGSSSNQPGPLEYVSENHSVCSEESQADSASRERVLRDPDDEVSVYTYPCYPSAMAESQYDYVYGEREQSSMGLQNSLDEQISVTDRNDEQIEIVRAPNSPFFETRLDGTGYSYITINYAKLSEHFLKKLQSNKRRGGMKAMFRPDILNYEPLPTEVCYTYHHYINFILGEYSLEERQKFCDRLDLEIEEEKHDIILSTLLIRFWTRVHCLILDKQKRDPNFLYSDEDLLEEIMEELEKCFGGNDCFSHCSSCHAYLNCFCLPCASCFHEWYYQKIFKEYPFWRSHCGKLTDVIDKCCCSLCFVLSFICAFATGASALFVIGNSLSDYFT